MEEVVLQAEARDVSKHSIITELRRQKKVPCVVYGGTKKNIHIAVNKKDLMSAIHSETGLNTIIALNIGDVSDRVLIHEIQRDVLTRDIIHVDFYRISMTEKLTVKVPVHLVGKAAGQEMGGVVDHVLRDIEVSCLAIHIPPKIDVDITGLKIGDTITAEQLVLPQTVTLLTDSHAIVVHVVTADKEEPKPEVVAETAVAGEPEVIAKGKEKEEIAEEGTPAAKTAQPAGKPKEAEKEQPKEKK